MPPKECKIITHQTSGAGRWHCWCARHSGRLNQLKKRHYYRRSPDLQPRRAMPCPHHSGDGKARPVVREAEEPGPRRQRDSHLSFLAALARPLRRPQHFHETRPRLRAPRSALPTLYPHARGEVEVPSLAAPPRARHYRPSIPKAGPLRAWLRRPPSKRPSHLPRSLRLKASLPRRAQRAAY